MFLRIAILCLCLAVPVSFADCQSDETDSLFNSVTITVFTESEPTNTESPMTESGGTESTSTDLPVTRSGKTKSTSTESPRTTSGIVESTSTESPVTESDETKLTSTESRVTESSETKSASTESSVTESGETKTTSTDFLMTESGKTESTSTESPVTENDINTFGIEKTTGEVPDDDSCTCAPYWLCNDPITTEIDIHIRPAIPCGNYLEFCCKNITRVLPPTPATPSSPKKVRCGVRNSYGIDEIILDRALGIPENQSLFGEFPWMVAVHAIEENAQKSEVFQCGGSLIHPAVVLTAAHCVTGSNKKFKIRVGEWDTRIETEILPYQNREVASVNVHPQFHEGNLRNDIALLFLKYPVAIAKNVDVVCLPPQNQVIEDTRCLTTGWGRDLSGSDAEILKKTDVPIVARSACQEALRTTRLGNAFQLHDSFICAGGEIGKNTCKGDGGGPLVCPIEGNEGRYVQSGIVSWGLGECFNTKAPGAYVNVALFRDWIDKQMVSNNLDFESYQY